MTPTQMIMMSHCRRGGKTRHDLSHRLTKLRTFRPGRQAQVQHEAHNPKGPQSQPLAAQAHHQAAQVWWHILRVTTCSAVLLICENSFTAVSACHRLCSNRDAAELMQKCCRRQ